jgi:hypothetical protein
MLHYWKSAPYYLGEDVQIFYSQTHVQITRRFTEIWAAYNDSVQLSIGVAPSHVTESDVLAKWKRLKEESKQIRRYSLNSASGNMFESVRKICVFQMGPNKIIPQKYLRLTKSYLEIPRRLWVGWFEWYPYWGAVLRWGNNSCTCHRLYEL